MPTPTKRVRKKPEETSAEAKTRLIKARRSSVGTGLSWPEQFEKLKAKLRKKIKGGNIKILDLEGEHDFNVQLYSSINHQKLGYAGVEIRLEQGKLGLYIENLQGGRKRNRSGDFTEERPWEIIEFKKRNGKAWNVALVQELINAAYKAGFDRISLLGDAKNHFFYKKAFLLENYKQYLERRALREGKTIDQVIKEMQKRMELIYDRTAHDLGMRKVKGYWVLEFP